MYLPFAPRLRTKLDGQLAQRSESNNCDSDAVDGRYTHATRKQFDNEMALHTQIEALLPELRAYALTICTGSEADAEDLVQDAVERTLRSESTPSTLQDLRPWAIRVVRNLHYDELRKRRVRREYSSAQIRLLDNSGSAGDLEQDVLIRMAFDKLEPASREILHLIDVLGFKYAEAAEILGVPRGTIMSRVSRARQAMVALVEEQKPRPPHE